MFFLTQEVVFKPAIKISIWSFFTECYLRVSITKISFVFSVS